LGKKIREAEMQKIIPLLGYKLVADTTKTRRKCKFETQLTK